jgi:hypothetical protein
MVADKTTAEKLIALHIPQYTAMNFVCRMKWTGNADYMGHIRNPYDVRVAKPDGKKKSEKANFSLSMPQKHTGGLEV